MSIPMTTDMDFTIIFIPIDFSLRVYWQFAPS